MANRRYIKFGLRADKNLIDLGNTAEAVDNLIDGLAVGSDIFGNPYRFTSVDLAPLRTLSSTDLGAILNPTDNLPQILRNLSGSVKTISSAELDSDLIDVVGQLVVQPQVTLQDRINRFKSVLGDPPFISGGSGPYVEYVHPIRLTQFTGAYDDLLINIKPFTQASDIANGTDQTENRDLVIGDTYKIVNLGDITNDEWNDIADTTSVTYGVGDVFVCVNNASTQVGHDTTAIVRDVTTPSGNFATSISGQKADTLPAKFLFTKTSASNYPPSVISENDWENGNFEWDGPINRTFIAQGGLVQFNAFQVGGFNPQIETNGLLLVEENVTEQSDGWRLVKGTNTYNFKPVYSTTVATVNERTVITFSNKDDWRRVARYMSCTINGQGDTVISESSAGTISLGSDLQITDSNADIEFSYNESAVVEFNSFDFTRPPGDTRRQVRYSVWWPSGYGENYSKIFRDSGDSGSDPFNKLNFYKEQRDLLFYSRKFSFPYFRDNRIYELNQTGNTKVEVQHTFLNRYLNPQVPTNLSILESPNIFPRSTGSGATVESIPVKVSDDGTIESSIEVFQDFEVGDWVVSSRNDGTQRYYAYQIIEKIGEDDEISGDSTKTKAYVSPQYLQQTGIAADTLHHVLLAKNQGLIAIYNSFQGTDADANSVKKIKILDYTSLDSPSRPYSIRAEDIIYKVDFVPANPSNTLADAVVSNNTHRYGMKLTEIDHNDSATPVEAIFDVESNPSDSSGYTLSTNQGVAFAYASRGLIDRSTLQECVDVYGKEVTNNVTGTTAIELNNVTGITPRSSATAITNVVIGTDGNISFDQMDMKHGDHIVVSGTPTGTGDITGYTNSTTYLVDEIVTGNSPNISAIKLSELNGDVLVTTSGDSAGLTFNLHTTGDFAFFEGKIPYNIDNMVQVGTVNSGNNTITLVDYNGTAVSLSGTLGAGGTVVFAPADAGPDANGWDKLNKEYCIIPLNTAPPWEGTTLGLRSPVGDVTNKPLSVQAKELRFVKLSFTVPTVNVESYVEDASNRTQFMKVKYTPPT
jgi:hypothetical protein